MKRFSKNKTALLLACISVLGNKTSAMNTSPKPQTIGAVTSSKKSNLTKLKIAGIIGVSILGAGLIYEILGDTILDVPTILKCIKNKNNNDPKTPEKAKPIENEKNITDSQKIEEPSTKNNNFLDKNKKHGKLKLTNEDGTLNIENTKKFLENKEKPKDKEMSNEEINTMLDKMLKILDSFGSKDPQFLKEYNEAVKNINEEEERKKIHFKMLLSFVRNNPTKRRGRVQVKIVNESYYLPDGFDTYVSNVLASKFADCLTSFKDDKSKVDNFQAKFTHNSLKYKIDGYNYQLELTNDEKNLNIQEWIYNHGKKTFEVTLTLCE